MFGNLEGAVRRGRGGKEKECTGCVQGDIRAFGIAGDYESSVLEEDDWDETVTEGGRRFMISWRKEEVDAARLRQKLQASRLGKLLSHTEAKNMRSDTNSPKGRVEGILYGRETDRDLRGV